MQGLAKRLRQQPGPNEWDRPDPESAGPTMLDATDQVRQITFTGKQLSTLAEIISVAIDDRREAVWCSDCDEVSPEGLCQLHREYMDKADEYAALAHDLGIDLEW